MPKKRFFKSKEQQEIQKEKDRLRKRNYNAAEREQLMKDLAPEIARLRQNRIIANRLSKELELKLAMNPIRRKTADRFDTSELTERVVDIQIEKVKEKDDFLTDLMKVFEENKKL